MTNSYTPEVLVARESKFAGNALRFATREEAEAYAFELSLRWTAVRETRVVESDDAVNYAIRDGRAVLIA
jgi:hypothetical protein